MVKPPNPDAVAEKLSKIVELNFALLYILLLKYEYK